MRILQVAALLVIALATGLAFAGDDSLMGAMGAGEQGYSATLTLIAGTSTNAACYIGYSSNCATGDCACRMFAGSGAGSIFGKSSAVSLALTADKGASTVGNNCIPAYGNLSITGSKDTETVDIAVTACQTTDPGLQITGGFQFREPSTRGLEAVGTVIVASPQSNSANLQMKLKGKAIVAPPPA